MALGTETFHLGIKYAQALGVTLLGVAAHQLHTDADAQDRLAERAYHLVQSPLTQVSHSAAGLALTGKDDTVSSHQFLRLVRHQRLHTQTAHGIHHGADVTGIVFYDCYIHFFLFIL